MRRGRDREGGQRLTAKVGLCAMRRAWGAALAVLMGCSRAATAPAPAPTPEPALKDVFRDAFMVGAALNPEQFGERDARGVQLITRHFNTITPENVLKWESVHPEPGRYDFAASDQYVAFGERHGLFVIGHALVWHNQVPSWVFQDASGRPASRDTLEARMRDHIMTVVGRYRGRIKGWDVVNEAIAEDGTLKRTPWFTILGDDYIEKAFRFAHEADPAAELYYNDYSLENAPKRAGVVALLRRLKAAGIRVAAVGTQEHNNLVWPSPQAVDSAITELAAEGVRVNVTELDVDVLPRDTQSPSADVALRAAARDELNPYAGGLPDAVQQALARRYADLFAAYLRHRDVIDRVTFWGVRDGDSWLNNWPIRGRTNYPLLFDRQGKPKPAFDAVIGLAQERPLPENP